MLVLTLLQGRNLDGRPGAAKSCHTGSAGIVRVTYDRKEPLGFACRQQRQWAVVTATQRVKVASNAAELAQY